MKNYFWSWQCLPILGTQKWKNWTYLYFVAIWIQLFGKFWWFFCSLFRISLLALVTPAFGRSDISGNYLSSNGKYFEIRRSHKNSQKFFRQTAVFYGFVTFVTPRVSRARSLGMAIVSRGGTNHEPTTQNSTISFKIDYIFGIWA